jgi:hypothetical protein
MSAGSPGRPRAWLQSFFNDPIHFGQTASTMTRLLPESLFAVPPLPSVSVPFRKSKWTPDEDALLRQNVTLHGLSNWTVVAQNVPGRSGKQCRERWLHQLCPALNKCDWTEHEDALLVEQQRICGNVWSQIAQFLPGRSPNCVKNRWRSLSRHPIICDEVVPDVDVTQPVGRAPDARRMEHPSDEASRGNPLFRCLTGEGTALEHTLATWWDETEFAKNRFEDQF